jgi:hypothetical protein
MIDMIIQARADFGRSIFREIIITACWIIIKDEIGLVYTFLIQAN